MQLLLPSPWQPDAMRLRDVDSPPGATMSDVGWLLVGMAIGFAIGLALVGWLLHRSSHR